jgi:predicted HTH transcriptional regulator
MIRSNPEVSFASASTMLGMTRDLVRKYFDALKRKGLIRHVGAARSGRWHVGSSDQGEGRS